jgi:hypothetical protein
VHYYGVFDERDRLVVLVSMNSDVSDSWEREGDNQAYFDAFGRKGYSLGVKRRRVGHDTLRSLAPRPPTAVAL